MGMKEREAGVPMVMELRERKGYGLCYQKQ